MKLFGGLFITDWRHNLSAVNEGPCMHHARRMQNSERTNGMKCLIQRMDHDLSFMTQQMLNCFSHRLGTCKGHFAINTATCLVLKLALQLSHVVGSLVHPQSQAIQTMTNRLNNRWHCHFRNDFAENNLINGDLTSFLNVFDKGHHSTLECKKHGQRCVQPDRGEIAASSGALLLRSSTVAVLRSGNERGVLRSKMSWFVSNGMKHGQQWDINFLCDMWEAWTFQANFMHESFQQWAVSNVQKNTAFY